MSGRLGALGPTWISGATGQPPDGREGRGGEEPDGLSSYCSSCQLFFAWWVLGAQEWQERWICLISEVGDVLE